MDIVAEVVVFGHRVHHFFVDVARMTCAVTNSHMGNGQGTHFEQIGEIYRCILFFLGEFFEFFFGSAAKPEVGIDVLAEEGYFFVAIF